MLYTDGIWTMHAIMFPIIALIAVGLWFLLRQTDKGAFSPKLIPFMVLSVFLVVIEIAKQIVEASDGSYDYFSLPFHVCSVFIFTLPLAAFLNQKWFVTKVFWALSVGLSVLMTIACLIGPAQIIGSAVDGVLSGSAYFLNWHSVLFHYTMILFTVLVIVFRPYKPQWKHFLFALMIYGAYMGLSVLMTNLLMDGGQGFAMFLSFGLGPFNQIRDSAGLGLFQFVIWLLYMATFTIAWLLLYYVPKLIGVIFKKRKEI